MTTLINNYSDLSKGYSLSYSVGSFFRPLKPVRKNYSNTFSLMSQNNENAYYISAELFDSFSKINSFAKFKENWNGYGASPFSKNVLDNAKKAILKLNYQPEIFPVADGSIQFEYDFNNSHMEMQIFEDYVETYITDADDNEKEFNDVFSVSRIKEIVDHFYEQKFSL